MYTGTCIVIAYTTLCLLKYNENVIILLIIFDSA